GEAERLPRAGAGARGRARLPGLQARVPRDQLDRHLQGRRALLPEVLLPPELHDEDGVEDALGLARAEAALARGEAVQRVDAEAEGLPQECGGPDREAPRDEVRAEPGEGRIDDGAEVVEAAE